MLRPHAARGAQLGDLLEEVVVDVPEERQALRERVDVEARGAPELDVGDAVGQREGQLLHGRRARLADVVAADADRVPARHARRAEDEHVAHDAQVRAHAADPLLLRDELLEHVVLQRAAERLGRDAAPLGRDDVEGEQRDGRRVDRHRRRDAGRAAMPSKSRSMSATDATETPSRPTSPRATWRRRGRSP